MNLGERIYKLRTEKNLSQGDLAEMLEVSRQSISKWETNSSVPDLDKIIKLSNIFGVTLDELVLGEESTGSVSTEEAFLSPPAEEAHTYQRATERSSLYQGTPDYDSLGQDGDKSSAQAKTSGFPPRKIAGTILLCMAFLVVLVLFVMGWGFVGLVPAAPFLACGIVCFICKKHVGLWCTWTLYVIIEIICRYMTGTNWSMIFYTFSELKINPTSLMVAWVEFAFQVVLIFVTVLKYCNKPISTSKGRLYWILAGWAVLVILGMPMPFAKYMVDLKLFVVYKIYSTVLAWGRIVLFTVLATKSVQFWHSKKAS